MNTEQDSADAADRGILEIFAAWPKSTPEAVEGLIAAARAMARRA